MDASPCVPTIPFSGERGKKLLVPFSSYSHLTGGSWQDLLRTTRPGARMSVPPAHDELTVDKCHPGPWARVLLICPIDL
jgi:hypothetical protein